MTVLFAYGIFVIITSWQCFILSCLMSVMSEEDRLWDVCCPTSQKIQDKKDLERWLNWSWPPVKQSHCTWARFTRFYCACFDVIFFPHFVYELVVDWCSVFHFSIYNDDIIVQHSVEIWHRCNFVLYAVMSCCNSNRRCLIAWTSDTIKIPANRNFRQFQWKGLLVLDALIKQTAVKCRWNNVSSVIHDTPESDLIEWRLSNYDMYSSQTHTVYILCIDSSCVSLLFIYIIYV